MSISPMLAEDLVERVPGVFGVWAAAARKRIHRPLSRDGSMGQCRHERLEDMGPWTHHTVNIQHPHPHHPSTNSTSHHTCTDHYNSARNTTPRRLFYHTATSYDPGRRWRSDSASHHAATSHLHDIGHSSTTHAATNHHDHRRTYNN